MDNLISALIAGAISSGVVTFLKTLIPPFRRWFEKLADDEKQAGMLWFGVFIVGALTAWRIYSGGGLPTEPAAAARLVFETIGAVIAAISGQSGAFAATKHLGRRPETRIGWAEYAPGLYAPNAVTTPAGGATDTQREY